MQRSFNEKRAIRRRGLDDGHTQCTEGLARRHAVGGVAVEPRGGPGQARRAQDRDHDLPLGPGLGVRRSGQECGRDDRRGHQQEGWHPRRAGEAQLHRRGRRRRGAGLELPTRRPGREGRRHLRLDLVRQLQPARAARRGSQGPEPDVGLRRVIDPRGEEVPLQLPHAGERHAGDDGGPHLPSQEEARLQDHRGRQSGLCLGPRELGNLLDRAEAAQARRPDRRRVLPEVRRARLFDGSVAAPGAASRCRPDDLMGRRSRHLGTAGGAARALAPVALRARHRRDFAAAARPRRARRA